MPAIWLHPDDNFYIIAACNVSDTLALGGVCCGVMYCIDGTMQTTDGQVMVPSRW